MLAHTKESRDDAGKFNHLVMNIVTLILDLRTKLCTQTHSNAMQWNAIVCSNFVLDGANIIKFQFWQVKTNMQLYLHWLTYMEYAGSALHITCYRQRIR